MKLGNAYNLNILISCMLYDREEIAVCRGYNRELGNVKLSL